ncbi:hypothetical protein FQN50_009517 [Emmonsiellopsis sp. PD_5]|nr:hypothetical protein FQN50_009517 [Emmonsiellopsis sp. PD_5]
MLFQTTRSKEGSKDGEQAANVATPGKARGKPLVCMIFFFASQMSHNIETAKPAVADANSPPTPSQSEPSMVHRLDTLLSEVQGHARANPLVTKFETIPVEMAPPGRPRGTTRESMHDTLLLVNFQNKQAWRQWIQTKEWQEFMQRTERELVFRRLPHVRCANSLKGLRDPLEVLLA